MCRAADLALQKLQRCAASGGDVAHLVGQAGLLHCRHGITTTNDGDCTLQSPARLKISVQSRRTDVNARRQLPLSSAQAPGIMHCTYLLVGCCS